MIDLTALTERTTALDVALHTVQVTVDGRDVASAACAPLGLDTPQRMYSVSKSVTGLAVGLLADDGALGLDDPVVTHFPEMPPVHPWVRATTLRHMLAMRGPHRATTFKRYDGSWLESYFRLAPTHPPGTLFTYDTSGSYVLAALVERLSGTTVADYLRPRLLDPLGVDPGLRFLTSPEGTSHGGSGLICTPRDLMRLARLLVAGGVHGGTRLLPRRFLAAATGRQADTASQTWGASLRSGYGYQLWLPSRGGWMMFGLGGQMVYGDPARRLAVVVTADAQACASGDQRLLDDVLDLVVDPIVAAVDAGAPVVPAPEHVELAWPAPGRDGARSRTVDGRFTSVTDGCGPRELALSVDGEGGRLRTDDAWDATGGWDVPLRFDRPVTTRVGGVDAVVTAGWVADDVLDVRCALHGDDLATLRVRLAWATDGTLAVQSQAFCESADPAWTFHAAYSATDAGPAARA